MMRVKFKCREISLAATVLALVMGLIPVATGISIPYFGSFVGSNRQHTTAPPLFYNEHKEARIINSHHGGGNNDRVISPSSSSAASLAGGNYGHSPWISGTRDQFIRDQLVVLHSDSSLNRDAWKESDYLQMESDSSKIYHVNEGMPQSTRISPARVRNPLRKSKQQTVSIKTESEGSDLTKYTSDLISPHQQSSTGDVYELLPLALPVFRDVNENHNVDWVPTGDEPSMLHHEPVVLTSNNFLLPFFSNIFPYSSRAIASHSTLPPEAMIQLLKSPEQEISPLTRPQVKLPFPLSHDCSANNGGASGSKPLQFVVLPIVEPVAPLKPIFPKPPFLSSHYGQFPYIPPFNLFNKKPTGYPTLNLDGSNPTGTTQTVGGGSSGQFVPILNRPAPPLPFVFVQSLPLELIGQNVEMDILNSSPSQTSENKINEASPVPPSKFSSTAHKPTAAPVENNPGVTRPLPLIVIEKKKTPGQLPSSQIAPAAAVVEITKQSVPKTANGSHPSSTISVVKPIAASGSQLQTPQQQQEIQKAIEKLVPVAAAVLENVENQQKQQKDEISTPTSASLSTDSNHNNSPASVPTTESVSIAKVNEQEKSSLRPPLRPDISKEGVGTQKPSLPQNKSKPTNITSEEIGGIGLFPSEVEITEI